MIHLRKSVVKRNPKEVQNKLINRMGEWNEGRL